jgi:hypothetical protein
MHGSELQNIERACFPTGAAPYVAHRSEIKMLPCLAGPLKTSQQGTTD